MIARIVLMCDYVFLAVTKKRGKSLADYFFSPKFLLFVDDTFFSVLSVFHFGLAPPPPPPPPFSCWFVINSTLKFLLYFFPEFCCCCISYVCLTFSGWRSLFILVMNWKETNILIIIMVMSIDDEES